MNDESPTKVLIRVPGERVKHKFTQVGGTILRRLRRWPNNYGDWFVRWDDGTEAAAWEENLLLIERRGTQEKT